MIDRTHELPLKHQAELLGISRGTVYYHPEPIPEADLRLMRRICGAAIKMRGRVASRRNVTRGEVVV